MKSIACTFLFLIFIIPPFPVRANDIDSEDLADQAARDEFELGSQLYSEGKYAEAAKAFRAAYGARPTWKLWYNIGQAETAAGHYGPGLVAFENYLAQGGDEVSIERTDEVLAELKRLRQLVGSLDVVAEPGCVIRIDGDIRGTTPLEGLIKISAGVNHQLEIVKDGTLIHAQFVRISGGDERRIEVPPLPTPHAEMNDTIVSSTDIQVAREEPATTPSETLPPKSPLPDSAPWLKPAGIVLLGTGVAALAAGGITGYMALNRSGELEDNCPNHTCAESGAVDDMYASQSLGTASTIFFATGVALTVTGIIMLIAHKKRNRTVSSFSMYLAASTPQGTTSGTYRGHNLFFQGSF